MAGLLLYQTLQSAQSMSNQWLLQRARILAFGTSATGEFVLPAQLHSTAESFRFAIRESTGRIISASSEDMAIWSQGRGPAAEEPRFFYLPRTQGSDGELYAVDVRVDTPTGPVSVLVAGLDEGGEALTHAMLQEFFLEIAWVIPLFILITLVVGATAIRSGLRPLHDTAAKLATVKPDSLSTRLDTDKLPEEIRPLVTAVNHALDRLEAGFDRQREFTANAAHELRTPLAIISSALENMNGNNKYFQLRQDVSRMSRLVAQLLHVARLDSTHLDMSSTVDLCACARELTQAMAPQAISAECTLALDVPPQPVLITGDHHAIYDALRNLVENAITYSPVGSEIRIRVKVPSSVQVIDQGPGIPVTEHEKVFERFVRGQEARGGGAGLGLAIVRATMRAHGGSVEIDNQRSKGTCITLRFPRAA